MKIASITEAKNSLSKLIDGLEGGPVLILHRGRRVAPAPGGPSVLQALLEEREEGR